MSDFLIKSREEIIEDLLTLQDYLVSVELGEEELDLNHIGNEVTSTIIKLGHKPNYTKEELKIVNQIYEGMRDENVREN